MNNKNQKLVSRIICAALVPFLLFLNNAATLVAYAAPTVETTCPEGFTPTPNMNCEKSNPGTDDKCPTSEGWRQISKTATKLVCSEAPASSSAVNKSIASTIDLIGGLQSFLNKLIWPVLVLIGGLMENDLLYGNGMEEKLRDIWIPIRNLVNILFVIVLVGLALYNVLGLSDDNTSIKSMLPKIVIGLIAVNFSFLAIKVVLDGINVMTTSIFSLPDQVSTGLGDATPGSEESKRLCANLAGATFSQFAKTADPDLKTAAELNAYRTVGMGAYYHNAISQKFANDGNDIPDAEAAKLFVLASDNKDQIQQKINTLSTDDQAKFKTEVAAAQNGKLCSGGTLSEQGKLFLSHYNSRNAAFALALNMGKIVYYQDLKVDTSAGTANGYEKIFTNSLFSVVLYIIYAVSFIALFVVLMGRLVVMWLSIAVSPLLLLMIASPTVKEKMGGFSKLSEQFTKNAIAPVLIALSLTIGWIMLKAIQGLDVGTSTSSFLKGDPTGGIPVAGLDTLQDVIVALGVIGVVWMGVFAAAEGTIAEGAVNFIKEQVTSAGKWIGELPFKHLPAIPVALPDHPHTHYNATLPEMMDSISRAKQKFDRAEGLSERLGLMSESNANDLPRIHSSEDIKKYLKNNDAGTLSNKENREAFKTWIGQDENKRGALKTLRDSKKTDDQQLYKHIMDLGGPDDKKAEAAAKEIKRMKGMQRDAADGDAGKKPAITKDDATGQKLVKKVGGRDESVADTNARIKKVNDHSVKISGELSKGTPAAAIIQNEVKAIGALFKQTGKPPDPEDLTAIFGSEENATAAKKAFGSEDEFKKALGMPTPPAAATTAPVPPAGPVPPAPGTTPPPAPAQPKTP